MRKESLPSLDINSPLESLIFSERVAFLNESHQWTYDALQNYQREELRKLLRYVSCSVPFYKRLFKTEGLDWCDFESVRDLDKLPTIDKTVVQNNWKEFVPVGVDPKSLYYRATGGSSGSPLSVYMDFNHIARDKANTEYYMNQAGLSIFENRSVRLYGDKVPLKAIEAERYWYVAKDRRLVMSCYHVAESTAVSYVEAIDKFEPRYIHSRPSAILPLAQYINELGLQIKVSLDGIFCDGEYLTTGQREAIEKAFQTRVFLIYGHTEGCVMGFSCRESYALHFPPQIGVLEVIDQQGKAVHQDGARGEMVVTGFNNRMFPLIRYRTGDVGVIDTGACACGNHYSRLKTVEGRFQDYVVNRSGTLIPLAPLIFNYNDFDWHGIRQIQVFQDTPGVLILRIQAEPMSRKKAENISERVVNHLAEIAGGQFEFSSELVDELSRTAIGKFRYLEQKIDIKELSGQGAEFLRIGDEINMYKKAYNV